MTVTKVKSMQAYLLGINAVAMFFADKGIDIAIDSYPAQNPNYTMHRIECVSSQNFKMVKSFWKNARKLFPLLSEESDKTFNVTIPNDFKLCLVCGCSNHNACKGGCEWVTPNLCSKCQEKGGAA